jgi:hypothetical protein
MKLGEIEVQGQFERAGNRRLDANEVDFSTDNKGVGFEHNAENVARPRRRQPSDDNQAGELRLDDLDRAEAAAAQNGRLGPLPFLANRSVRASHSRVLVRFRVPGRSWTGGSARAAVRCLD